MKEADMEYVDKQVRGVFFSVLFIVILCFVFSIGVSLKECPDDYKKQWVCDEETNYGGISYEYWACVSDGVIDLNEHQCDEKIKIRQYSEPKQECLKGHNICVRVD